MKEIKNTVKIAVLGLIFLMVCPISVWAAYTASDLLGQLDGSNNPIYTVKLNNNAPGDTGLGAPYGVVMDTVRHRLFVSEFSRILVYNLDSNNNLVDRVADYVLGQTTLRTATITSSPTQNTFNFATEMAYDSVNDRLFVADVNGSRVLVFNTSTISNGMNASYVLGKPNFTAGGTYITQNGTGQIRGLAFDSAGNRLFVADATNHRILVFDTTTITNSMNASNVIGQVDFTSVSSGTTQSTLKTPQGLFYDSAGNRLFVADSLNHRVLVFNTTTITNGMNASNVLGQADFTSGTALTAAQNTTRRPEGLALDASGNRLFVGSSENARVLVFNTTTITNGMNASNVLGQGNFTSTSYSTPTQSSIEAPAGLFYDSANTKLFVADKNDARVSIFDVSAITNGENMVNLIGQLDSSNQPVFTTNHSYNSPNSKGFNRAVKMALDTTNHKLFVSDYNNNRILVFNLDANNDLVDRIADNVLGQANFTTTTAATTQSGLRNPLGLYADSANSRLFVADSSNHRVLVFNTSTITDGMNAANVLGEPDFVTANGAITQDGMQSPADVQFDATRNRLFVAMSGGTRVLVFNTTTITNGMNASKVIGQANFTANVQATAQNTFTNVPVSLAYNSVNDKLFVADSVGNRILVFDTTTITDGMNASNVIGQANFTAATAATTQSGLSQPISLSYDSNTNTLFAADYSNRRIVTYDTTTITDGMNANNVLGQNNFTSSTDATDQSFFGTPYGIAFDATNNRLYTADDGAHRVLAFDLVSVSNSSLASGQVGQSYSASLTNSSSQGTVTYAIISGSLPAGLSLSGSSITGTPTTVGTSNFTVQATDTLSTGTFKSQPAQLSITITAASGGGGGGGGGGGVYYIGPSNVSFKINEGVTVASNRNVTLNLTYGTDVNKIMISNRSDMADATQQNISPTMTWDLCSQTNNTVIPTECISGVKTVYVKFYSIYNQPSSLISASINYDPQTPVPEPVPIVPTAQPVTDGKLFLDKGIIYVMEYGLKRPFTAMSIFTGLGYKLANVFTQDISDVVSGSLMNTTRQRHPRGALIQHQGTIYFMGKDFRFPYPSKEVYDSWNGEGFEEVINASTYDLQVPVGPVVPLKE